MLLPDLTHLTILTFGLVMYGVAIVTGVLGSLAAPSAPRPPHHVPDVGGIRLPFIADHPNPDLIDRFRQNNGSNVKVGKTKTFP